MTDPWAVCPCCGVERCECDPWFDIDSHEFWCLTHRRPVVPVAEPVEFVRLEVGELPDVGKKP